MKYALLGYDTEGSLDDLAAEEKRTLAPIARCTMTYRLQPTHPWR